MSNITFLSPGAAAATVPHDPPPHRCGRCNNGTGVTNPDCPNNTGASDR